MGNPTSLAVIPARSGSKRVPGKNLQHIGGVPLVLWTARAARDSKLLTKYVVSTECSQIKEVVRADGHDYVPRPDWMAGDAVWSSTVVLHALRFNQSMGFNPDYVVLLHPTSPFRTGEQIDECLEVAQERLGPVISFTDDDLNGALYVWRAEAFKSSESFFGGLIFPYLMDSISGLDIDTPEDLWIAREVARWMNG